MRVTQATSPRAYEDAPAPRLGLAGGGATVEPEKSAIERRHDLRHEAGRLLGGRTARCGCYRRSQVVQLFRTEHGAKVNGVETCGSIWSCPVCAAKIAEGKRALLEELMQRHKAAGGSAAMLTLTVPHGRFDDPKWLRDGVMKCWSRMIAGRPWRSMLERFEIIGNVRALEVTHGGNGWHPHLHVLLFSADDHLASELTCEDIADAVFPLWEKQVRKHLGAAAAREALDCRPADTAADYVAKWGADSEIAKASQKISRKGGRSPWQLLADSRDGDKRAGALFIAYAAAFKGARHLAFTKGLREMYDLRDLPSDDVLADEGEELDLQAERYPGRELVMEMDAATWDAICRKRLQGSVLTACARGGREAVEALLAAHHLGSYITDPETETRRWRRIPRKLTRFDIAGQRDRLKLSKLQLVVKNDLP